MASATSSAGIETLDSLFGPHLQALCRRTAQALETCGYDALLVHSGSLLPVFQDDRTYPFEVNAPFKAWTPLDEPDCFVYFRPGHRPRLVFTQPEDYWYKPPQPPEGYWTAHFDILPCTELASARTRLPSPLSATAYVGDAFPELVTWGVAAVNPPRLLRHLDFGRVVKSPYELACLREASRLGARGHLAARDAFRAGASEFEIELAFLAACGLREQELPYNPIIAFNESGSVLHYQVLGKTSPIRRHSLLIDAGAEFGGYASDITRTYSAADEGFAALIERMNTLQQTLCAGIKAGVDWRDVHLSAHRLSAALLAEAGIVKCTADEAFAAGATRVFLPHGVGHLLGLEVHDVGGFISSPEGGDIPRPEGHPHLRLTRVLEPGFVVTMEPGIYFNETLLAQARSQPLARLLDWSCVEHYRVFGGIRVEDDLAVTATGYENLTRNAFAAEHSGK